jgi:predicted nucleotidyltransferase
MVNRIRNYLNSIPGMGEIVLLGISGSRAYDLNVKGSNTNIMGIVANTSNDLLLGQDFKEFEDVHIHIYSLSEAFNLLLQGDMKVLELLFLKKYLYVGKYGQLLIDNRDLFLTKKVYKSINQDVGGYSTDFVGYLRKDKDRANKNAMHIVRLCNVGIELFNTGKLNVTRRQDKKLLLSIRDGSYEGNLDYLIYDKMNELDESYINTNLPNECDYEKVNKLKKDINLDIIVNGELNGRLRTTELRLNTTHA